MSTDRTTDLMRHRGVIITVYHYSFHYCWHAEQPSWILSFLVKNMNSILTAKPYTIMISMYISIELEHSYSLFILRIICRARCQQQQRSQRLVTAALANWRKTTIMKYSNFPFFSCIQPAQNNISIHLEMYMFPPDEPKSSIHSFSFGLDQLHICHMSYIVNEGVWDSV